MTKKSVSVALTTYNGEKYILTQIESIYNQTQIPDEVIICDDCSKDNTISIIEDFIYKKGLKNWKLIKNSECLGWKDNFFKAISLTSGDVVFFSDQDDIWMKDKIEVMSSILLKYNMGALHGSKKIIDSNNKEISEREEQKTYSNKLYQYQLKRDFYDIITLGCCMCVSREVANIYLGLNYPEGGHDSQCGRIAALYSSLYYLDRPVINYRIHAHNTSGISQKASYGQSTLERRINNIIAIIAWIDKLQNLDNRKNRMVLEVQQFLKNRLGYFNDTTSFFCLLRKIRYYKGITSLIGDFAYKHHLNNRFGQFRWKIEKMFH